MHIFPSIPDDTFDGYIFDCDGTLANSMPMFFDSWLYALNKHNSKFDFTWDMFHSMAGMGLVHSIEQLNDRFQDSLDPHGVIVDIKAYVEQHKHTIQPIAEVVEMARKFSKLYPISVASGGPRDVVHQTLKIIKADDIFHHIVTQDDVVNCKPHPEIFLYAAEKMGVRPDRCLVFEDSLLGIEAAQKAGMTPVLVKNERSSIVPSGTLLH